MEAETLRLFQLLQQHKLSVATAESCTGGMIASALVSLSGISDYFEEGYVTYSDAAKTKMLGVDAKLIQKHGVVSLEVAEAMATGAAKTADSNCGIATTGIAGPGGGTPETPVGYVCFACCVKGVIRSRAIIFDGNRYDVRTQASCAAIQLLCDTIEEVCK